MSAATDKIVAAGTKLFAKGPGDGSFAQVASIFALAGPDQTADNIDTTELDPYYGSTIPSNPEFWKTFIAGWRDAGQVTFTIFATQTGYVQVHTWFKRGNTVDWYIQLRNGVQIPLSGHLSALGQTSEKEDMVKCPITIKASGATSVTTPTTTTAAP